MFLILHEDIYVQHKCVLGPPSNILSHYFLSHNVFPLIEFLELTPEKIMKCIFS